MESTLELTKIKEVLQKNLKILIILPLLFLIISAIVTFFVLSPKYQANTQILVNQTKGDNPQFMAQEVQSNIQLVNTYKEIVKSPRILDEVSKDLNDKYSPSKLSSMLTITNQENTQPTSKLKVVINKIRKKLRIASLKLQVNKFRRL
ncbi:capsular polysaccharide type 5 biosynthesis protein cap5A [Staphylococcus aureus M1538]|nr:capsular polysaccharide type 5 biosynthesis protein cap5A [Staphylococcus aureus M0416]EVT48431.1 capsular polysaccharide type 5 biosynthesis protein cap5A [Staphylococcus aureus M1538]